MGTGWRGWQRWGSLSAIVLLTVSVSSCYLTRTLTGGLRILAARRPIPEVLADPRTAPALAVKLRRVLDMREFASDELALPDNGSYRSWVELNRPYAVWNVVAAPELALDPLTWCFPIVGCVSYRGYFSEARAQRHAAELRRRGYDVAVGGVAAYSTLGWFRDPVLSTFLDLPAPDLAGLIFHELAHQRLYVAGDVPFNESFATTVELAGVRRWLAARGEEAETAGWQERRRREEEFLHLLRRARERLEEVYAAAESDGWKRQQKTEALARLREEYRELRDGPWQGWAGYDAWFAQDLGNAHLAALGAYDRWVPALEALLGRFGGDLPRFYTEVERLGELPEEERGAALTAAEEGFR